jgi:hypothetical protein
MLSFIRSHPETPASRLRIRNLSLSENRLENHFNLIVSNGDFLQVIDFDGAPFRIKMRTLMLLKL